MEIFKNTEYPKRYKDAKGKEEYFSVDVISCDKNGMLNICYWNYDNNIWICQTDTLYDLDLYEGDELIDFVWMYKPNELKIDKSYLSTATKE